MTELEKIKYAKRAVEKLANGINPFTGQGSRMTTRSTR